ncbi:SFT2 family protein [Besnoitia besnoiti]|uniref:Vesicle transport protein n=1 Tax=Besnoitia besnoiti TaxID=94643 RepID=A0A2A9MG04_BESBE|nr:SFT2 family protein [Besnoitia besnoiti]PFH34527.1 SFT2 family protein [Besnoitia besnoiti]
MPRVNSTPLLPLSHASARQQPFRGSSALPPAGSVPCTCPPTEDFQQGTRAFLPSHLRQQPAEDRGGAPLLPYASYHHGRPSLPRTSLSSSRDMAGRLLFFPRSAPDPSRGAGASALVGAEEEDEEEGSCCFPPLTLTERLLGWLTCFLGGLVISSLALGSFQDLIRGKSTKFAVAYTLGNCVGLLGTAFLVGFRRQMEGMMEKSRLWCSLAFAASIIGTLLCSVFLPVAPLVILCLIVQWLAYIWYSLSYIPYGRESIWWCIRWVSSRF